MKKLMSFALRERKLAFSVLLNLGARLPGIAGIFLVLPFLKRNLGQGSYGELLAALALGTAFSLPLSGISVASRRLIGAAHFGTGNYIDRDVFAASSTLSFAAFVILSGTVAASVCLIPNKHWGPAATAVAILPLLAGFLNLYDNMRVGLNEYWVTAALQFISQILMILILFLIIRHIEHQAAAAFVLQGPFVLASLAALITLIMKRPGLLGGGLSPTLDIIKGAFLVVASSGSITFALNAIVVWVSQAGGPEFAAWYGTMARLFQTLSVPAIAILLPIAGHLTSLWPKLSATHRAQAIAGVGLCSLVYALTVGMAVVFLGKLYMSNVIGISVEVPELAYICIAAMMSAMLFQSTYCTIIYSIAVARFISILTPISVATSFVILPMYSAKIGFLPSLYILCLSNSLPLFCIVAWDIVRRVVSASRHSPPDTRALSAPSATKM